MRELKLELNLIHLKMSQLENVDPSHLLRIKKETLKILARRGYKINDSLYLNMTPENFVDIFENKKYQAQLNVSSPMLIGIGEKKIYSLADGSTSTGADQYKIRAATTNPTYRTYLSNVYEHTNSSNPKRFLVFFTRGESADGKSSVPKAEATLFSKLYLEMKCSGGMFIAYEPFSTQTSQCLHEISSFGQDIKDEESNDSENFVQIFNDSELLYDPLDHSFSPRYEVVPSSVVRKLKDEKYITPSQFGKMTYDDPIAKRLGLRPGNVVKCNRRHIISDSMINSSITYLQVTAPPTRKKERSDKKEKT